MLLRQSTKSDIEQGTAVEVAPLIVGGKGNNAARRSLLHPFSLVHDFVFWGFLLAAIVGDLQEWNVRPDERSTCAYAMVVPLGPAYLLQLTSISNGVLTLWLSALLAEESSWPIRLVVLVSATITGIGLCSLVLIPRCQFWPHQIMVFAGVIGANLHQLLLLIIYRSQLSKVMFIPQLVASLVSNHYYYNTTDFYWFMIAEVVGVEAYMKFLTGVVYPTLPEPKRPKWLNWAAIVIPAACLMLYVNREMHIWCANHSSTLGRMNKNAWTY